MATLAVSIRTASVPLPTATAQAAPRPRLTIRKDAGNNGLTASGTNWSDLLASATGTATTPAGSATLSTSDTSEHLLGVYLRGRRGRC